jgi:hypothetical protein
MAIMCLISENLFFFQKKKKKTTRAERQLLGSWNFQINLLFLDFAGEGHAGFGGLNYEQFSQVL